MNLLSNDKVSDFDHGSGMDNEMDWYALWQKILLEKALIIGIMLISILAAGSYAFLTPPIFQSKAYFVPVEKESVQKLSDFDLLLGREERFTPQRLFKLFKQNISYRSNLWTFFLENKLYVVYDSNLSKAREINSVAAQKKIKEAFAEFTNDILFYQSKENDINEYLSVSLEMPLAEETVKNYLEDYITQVENRVKKTILGLIKSEQKSRVENLIQQINAMRETAKLQKDDRLAQLDEAIIIARSLKLKEPPTMGAKATIQGVSNQGLPMYYLGYRLLEAERKVLVSRESNDPFINGLRALQEKRFLLSAYEISMEDFETIKLDQNASIGEKIKPKKALILIFSVVVGFLLGISIASIKISYSRRKQRQPSA